MWVVRWVERIEDLLAWWRGVKIWKVGRRIEGIAVPFSWVRAFMASILGFEPCSLIVQFLADNYEQENTERRLIDLVNKTSSPCIVAVNVAVSHLPECGVHTCLL